MSGRRNYIPRRIKRRLRLFVILTVLSFILGLVSVNIYNRYDPTESTGKRLQLDFIQKEKSLRNHIASVSKIIESKHQVTTALLKDLSEFNNLYSNNGYGLCIFKGDEAVYWTDNHICYEDILTTSANKSDRIVNLPNSTNYLVVHSLADDVKIYGLIQIIQEFDVNNNYLKSGISPHLKLSDYFNLDFYREGNSFPIYDSKGDFVFSIKCDSIKDVNRTWGQVAVLLFSTFFLLMMVSVSIVAWMNRSYFYLNVPILCIFSFFAYKILQLPLFLDSFLYRKLILSYELSAPHIPTMSLLYMFVVTLSFVVLIFSSDVKRLLLLLSPSKSRLVGIAFLIFSAVYAILLGKGIGAMVDNVSFSLTFYRILDVSASSVLGVLFIGTLTLNTFRASRIVITTLCRRNRPCDILIVIFTISVIMILMKIIRFDEISVYTIIFFFCANSLFVVLKSKFVHRYRLTYVTMATLVMALYITIELSKAVENREWNLMEMQSLTLEDNSNIDVETRLQDVGYELIRDTAIIKMFEKQVYAETSFDGIYDRVKQYYLKIAFSGYDVGMVAEISSLYDHSHRNTEISALNYLISSKGKRIGESPFYFLGHDEGLNSYIGRFNYMLGNGMQATLLVNIHKKNFFSRNESSMLLYSSNNKESPLTKHFSYGKYYNNTLIYQEGDFAYSRGLPNTPNALGECLRLRDRGYNHLINKVGEHSHIIVSSPSVSISNYITSFGYIFIIDLIFTILITWLFSNGIHGMWQYKSSIRTKIQVSVIAVNLIVTVLLTLITISGNITKNIELKKEELNRNAKIVFDYLDNAVNNNSSEENKLDVIKKELPKLTELVWNFIVLYDAEGQVITTTNPEVDRLGIVGEVMDIDAFYNFRVNMLFKYSNDNRISNLKYHSIYQSIITQGNKQVGYLCVPYITVTTEDARVISNTFITLINMFVLVFVLSVIASVFISNQITLPLTMLRDNLMSIKLGRSNKKLIYNSSDEIGSLVQEYNLSLDKIEENSKLIARTERELAWREMAKQIAHEVKNPLTPLKLNIQFLQNAIHGDFEKFKELFSRISATIIDQIDELARVSTAFSDFAKIPAETICEFDLNEQLLEICNLFSAGQDSFQLKYVGKEIPVYIEADAGQISRVFSNIIKNAIQACRNNVNAVVEVELFTNKNNAIISIKDNGEGISKEIFDKLFTPNFTTKSSGMGIGLSIAYNIVRTFNGDISFTSELGKGSTFIVTLPLRKLQM